MTRLGATAVIIESVQDRRPLLIVDGDNLAHRAYHSTPKTVVGKDGQPINAFVGFFGMLTRIWDAEAPRGILVAWDTLGTPTYRDKLWPAYQSGRVIDAELRSQLDRFPDLCRAGGLGVGKQGGYEADDFMASAADAEVANGGTCLILTTDKDSYQLASDHVTILSPQRKTRELERIGPLGVVEKFRVLPEQVPDFKALSGDPSDKIPGIKGIGPQTAAALLLQHGKLEKLVATWTNPRNIELAMVFREVCTMRRDAPVTLPDGPPNWADAVPLLREMGAETLADRLEARAS